VCEETGCEYCGQAGTLELVRCPLAEVPDAIWQAAELAGFLEKGVDPLPGEKPDAFWKACRILWNEQARIECEKAKKANGHR
jgi:hypothetical protein